MSESVVAPLLAFLPIAWLLFSLGALKMAMHKACALGLGASALLAFVGWGVPARLLGAAVLDGFAFAAVPILWVILAAFLTYNIALRTNAIEKIKDFLSSISRDRRIQALLIAWGFGSFLEAVAGFGTAVAVPAALLIALGFSPFPAALLCLLANTVAVAFGVLGIPITTLAQITELPVSQLSEAVVFQLTPFAVCVPALIVLTITRSLSGLLEVWPQTFAAGAGFGAAQFLAAKYIGPELPAVMGSLAAFVLVILAAKLFPPKNIWTFSGDDPADDEQKRVRLAWGEQLRAWSPYILLFLLVGLTSRLFPEINAFAGKVKSSWLIYDAPGGKPFTIAWLATPGSLVFVSAVCGGLIQGASPRDLAATFAATIRQLSKTALTILCIVGMAKVLGHSGMVASIAGALAASAGKYYAFISPALGMLGTFITGSDTSSNILFGLLQKQVALEIGADPVWLAAANTSGACVGKLISPQSLAVAGIAAGLAGKEGPLLSAAMHYAGGFIVALCLLVFLAS